MVDTPLYTFVQTQNAQPLVNPRVNPTVNCRLSDKDKSCRPINCSKCTLWCGRVLMVGEVLCMCGGRKYMEIFVSSQFCSEPETALKTNVYLKEKKGIQ